MFLGEYKYFVEKRKMHEHIANKTEISSDDSDKKSSDEED